MPCLQPACGCCGWRNTRTATGIFFRTCHLCCRTACPTLFHCGWRSQLGEGCSASGLGIVIHAQCRLPAVQCLTVGWQPGSKLNVVGRNLSSSASAAFVYNGSVQDGQLLKIARQVICIAHKCRLTCIKRFSAHPPGFSTHNEKVW